MVEITRVRAGIHSVKTADEIGAKAANLADMAACGLPVPPAFVLPVGLCKAVVDGDGRAEREMAEALQEGVDFLETETGRRFGDRRNPLLVSVRSGAARSMPGMLDSVLNVGCTSVATQGLIRASGNARFAWDCRRRFLEGFAETVLGLDPAPLMARLHTVLLQERAASESELDSEAFERLVLLYSAHLSEQDIVVPDLAMEQLAAAAGAVYRSWNSERARSYRRIEKLEHLAGTAVTVQVMVFGNRGSRSGSGVAFSRDPSNGSPDPVIEVLRDAQGEDVVSGRRTPDAIAVSSLVDFESDLIGHLKSLERRHREVQDIEFTVEDGTLWLLQARAAKRSPRAALRIAIDLVREGLISPDEAVRRLEGVDPAALAVTHFSGAAEPAATGLGVSGGVTTGRAAFDSEAAGRLAGCGDAVVLMRPDTNTADVEGFSVAAGIVTAVGGRTAHAALVARQMGKPCVVGCAALAIYAAERRASLGEARIVEGDWVSIDGDTGTVFLGRREVVIEEPQAELREWAAWRRSTSMAS